jgi:general secretion pathway protein F
VPKFRYTAIDGTGKSVRGVVDAVSTTAVVDLIQGQGRLLLRADEVARHRWGFELPQLDLAVKRGLPKAAIAHFTRELSVMLSAGQDIDHALRFLVESSEDKRSRRILQALRDRVRGGTSLAAALADHPRVFSRLYISLVRAGEARGKLA